MKLSGTKLSQGVKPVCAHRCGVQGEGRIYLCGWLISTVKQICKGIPRHNGVQVGKGDRCVVLHTTRDAARGALGPAYPIVPP